MDLNSNRSNRPVNRSEPVAREILNLFEFGFEFNRFRPVTGQTGPVNRNRSPAVTGYRSGNKTLLSLSAYGFRGVTKKRGKRSVHRIARAGVCEAGYG